MEKNQKQIDEGIEKLAECFYRHKVDTPNARISLQDLGAVRLNSRVSHIEFGKAGKPIITALSSATGKEERKEYPAVIVATTTRAMQVMGLTLRSTETCDVLSEKVKEALRNLYMINSSKLFIRTRTKFWLNSSDRIPANIQTEEMPRAIYLLDYPQTENGVVCVSYTWEDDSVRLLGLEPEERFRIFKKCIDNTCPALGRNLVAVNGEIISIDWQAEPFYYGAFKLQLPGQDQNLRHAYYQFQSVLAPHLDRGVYLAGDGVSWTGGWIEGALHTGINAACAVAKRLGAELPAGSPLEQNPHRYRY